MKIEKINQLFNYFARFILKHRLWVIFIYLVVMATSFVGLMKLQTDTSYDSYFLENDPMLVKTDEFREIFGNDNYLAVLTTTDNTFTQNNLRLIRELSDELLEKIPYAEKITSLTNLEYLQGDKDEIKIEQIVPELIPQDPKLLQAIKDKAFAKEYIAKKLISKDSKHSWIVLKLEPFPENTFIQVGKNKLTPDNYVGYVADTIIKQDKYAPIHPEATGMPYVSYEKALFVNLELSRILLVSLLISLFLLLITTRSVIGVVAPILCAISSIVITYGITGYLHYVPEKSTTMIPIVIIFAVSIAYNIHIFIFFKKMMLEHGNRKNAIIETLTHVGWPVLFSGLTTVVCLLTILAIPVRPLHFTGAASASAVMLALLLTLVLFPIMLSFGKNKIKATKIEFQLAKKVNHFFESLALLVLNHSKFLISVFIVIVVFFSIGLFKIEPAFDIERTAGRQVPYVGKVLKISETEIGSLYSYDVLIEFLNEGDAKLPENLKKFDQFTGFIENLNLSKRVTSIADVLKDINFVINGNDYTQYIIPSDPNQVAQLLLLYENTGGTEAEYWIDYEYKRLRAMVELVNFNSAEASQELNTLEEYAEELFPQAKIQVVGTMPQFLKMMEYVTYGQIYSILIAFLLIAVLLMIVFRSIRTGLIGLIPNIMPVVVAGGLMGWLGIPLDMMTATILPMILGLSVDDTIHLINNTNLEFDKNPNYDNAITKSFLVVGTPLCITTLIMCGGFSSYLSSEVNNIFNLGLVTILALITALLSDLCITPIIIKKFQSYGKEKN